MCSTVFLKHSGKAHILDTDRGNINSKMEYLLMTNVLTLSKYVLDKCDRLEK